MGTYMRVNLLVIPVALVLAASTGPAGAGASVATQAASSLMTWGDNSAGELGNGSLDASTTPVAVGGSGGITAVSAGGCHVLALDSGGTVEAWGDDTSGQLGTGAASANGDAENPVTVPGLSDVTQVAAGTEHSLALLSNGTVMAWGDNSRGELGDGTTTSSAVPVAVPGLTGVTAVAAGDEFSLAVLSGGEVMAWGDGGDGQLGNGTFTNIEDVPVRVKGLTGVTAVSAGGQQALALESNGTAEAWGENFDGQLGNGGGPGDVDTPVQVSGLTSAVAVAAGEEYSMALLANGTVDAWGDNGFDELGQPDGVGGIENSNVPVQVPDLGHVTAISAGALFGLALAAGGTVDAWGDGSFGQLGNATTNTVAPPVAVSGLTSVSAISAGGASAAAVVPAAAPAPPAPTPSIWQVTGTPRPHNVLTTADQELDGVSALNTDSAWAVGSSEVSGEVPLAEHWNGSTWSKEAVPLPSGATSGELDGVDELSPGDVWAVGSTDSSQSDTLIEHWNGRVWSTVPSPDPGESNTLVSVTGQGPDDVWAAGWFESTGGDFIAVLLAHWNGTAWSMITPPSEGGIQFGDAVTEITPKDIWVVGDTGEGTFSARWNGTSWRMVNTPILQTKDSLNFLTGVSAVSASDIWASGYEGNVNDTLFSQPYMLHWNGSSWTLTELPDAGTEGSSLRATVALSASDVWAVGDTDQDDGALLALTEHFNGTGWSISPAAEPGQLAGLPDNTLAAVASPGPGMLEAVGAQESPGRCCLETLAMQTSSG
jgi:alpha-tubulin suppressor-like RCC1 family protein